MTDSERKLVDALNWMIRVFVDQYQQEKYPLSMDENAAYINALRVIAQTEGKP